VAVVRKSISLPPALAAKLEAAARERRKSVSEVVARALERELAEGRRDLPFEYAFDGPEDLSERADETLAATWTNAIERHR
jgi:hypothetical protein